MKAIISFLLLAIPSVASAHAVVFPKASTQGAYERYVLRVPNEKDVPTTRVEMRFPSNMRVLSFTDVQGWQLEILRDSSKAIVGAVWTGTLPPERFVEFPFVAVNPKTDATIVWPAYQTYEGGERVEWTGAPESERPASSTVITQATATSGGGGNVTGYVAFAALAVSLLSLGLALRRSA